MRHDDGRGAIRTGVRRLFRLRLRADAPADADEELASFLDARVESLVARGMSPAAARAEALRRLGGPSFDAVRERLRRSATHREDRMRFRETWDRARQDLRVAARGLRRAPALVATAVLSLALGIGANAAIFSLFDALLLRPLPVSHPERLVKLVAPGPRYGSPSCGGIGPCDEVFSYAMFRDLERATTRARGGLTGVAAHVITGMNLAYGGRTEHARGVLVSGAYFSVLGVRPALGRLLGPEDDRAMGAHPVVVLSHDFWQARLGGDAAVVGRTVHVGGHAMTIVGVAPRGFEGTTRGVRPALFVPLAMTAQVAGGIPGMQGFETNRDRYWLFLFGRLKPGVGAAEAGAALNATYRAVITDVEAPRKQGLSAEQLAQFRASALSLAPARRGQSLLAEEVRTPLVLLFAVSAVVLLIACANIANLLLARGVARGIEVAVRVSLGAGRRRVVAQLLTESLLLAALGGVAGLLVAHGTLAAAAAILPPDVAAAAPPGLRWPAVAFAAGIALATGVLVGLYPALHGTRPDLVTTIRANAGQIAGARGTARSRAVLVAGQIALSMALLVAAGLFLKSLRNIARTDLGLAADRIVTFELAPELSGYAREGRQRLFRRVEEALASLPGVTGVSSARIAILAGGGWGTDVVLEGEGVPSAPGGGDDAWINLIGPDFFRTLGVPVLAGREFTPSDRAESPGVAIVNEAFVRKFGLGRGAVGRRVGVWGDRSLGLEIVGVVRNAKYGGVKDGMEPAIYTANRQDPGTGMLTFYVRSAGDPSALLREIPVVVARVDATVPVQDLKTLPQQIQENVSLDRAIGALSGAFAALATLLAAVGLYGVLAYTVAHRAREIGVRMALGADARRVRGLVLRQVGALTLAGGAVGVLAALALGRAAQSLLFGLAGHDPAVLAGAGGLVALVALAAAYVPARRASRLDPIRALRAE